MFDPGIMFGGAIVWLGLLIVALAVMRGRWRTAAAIPGAAMLAAVAVGVLGGLAGSNLAPIWIFIAFPFCAVWLGAVWLLWCAARAWAWAKAG